jgi:predicted transcriptional regulator
MLSVFSWLVLYIKNARVIIGEIVRRKEINKDILRSRAVSDVLFQIIAGERSPIEISRAVGDTPPAVIKQLWRLRKAGVVTLAEKAGKFQNYNVNWERLMEEAANRMISLGTAMVLASLSNNVERYNLLASLGDKLKKNEHFGSLFKAFFEEEAKRRETTDVYLTTETFQDAVSKFERFLPSFCPSLRVKSTDAETKELLSLFKTLCEAIEEASGFEAIPLKRALEKTGFL